MARPKSGYPTTAITYTGLITIDSILGDYKWWQSSSKEAVTLSYSFPWTTRDVASFLGPDGSASTYSVEGELDAEFHFNLNEVEQNAFRDSLVKWSSVANITFSEINETSSNVGVIRVAFSSADGLQDSWGWAYKPNNYYSTGGDIWINADYADDDKNWGAGSYNYESLLHESGHTLGLTHSFEGENKLPTVYESTKYTLMSYTDRKDNTYVELVNNRWQLYDVYNSTPMIFDILAVQKIYGANNNFNSGDDVYSFDSKIPFYKTIWDGAGNDTISAASFDTDVTISLLPGSFSSLLYDVPVGYKGRSVSYDGRDNLSIAYDCLIENATGGSGSDYLLGNDIDNKLQGGDGNDILVGGLGNDTFDWDQGTRQGDDIFYGGLGDDVYVIDSENDDVIEKLNEGNDVLWVSGSYNLRDDQHIETINGYGSNGVSVTGNNLNNFINGSDGNDILVGGLGNDTFDWDKDFRKGDDIFYGGLGDDVYVIDSENDDVIEKLNEGNDVLWVSGSYNLRDDQHIETINGYGSNGVSVTGNNLNNLIRLSSGNDTINGNGGIDTCSIDEISTGYSIFFSSDILNITTLASGANKLTSIERLKFYDLSLAFDIEGSNSAGGIYRTYQAAFNRTPDKVGFGYWIDRADNGASAVQMAEEFVWSAEFQTLYNVTTNDSYLIGNDIEAVVDLFYRNVLGRAPDQGGLTYYTSTIEGQSKTSGRVLAEIADSAENRTNLLPTIENGMSYDLWVA